MVQSPGAVPTSAVGGSPALSFVLSTAEGMLQHCRQAVQPCPSAGATLGWDCPSAGTVPLQGLSLCSALPTTERLGKKGRQTQSDPGTSRQERHEHLPENSTKAHLQ